MQLDGGRYHFEVSAKGYEAFDSWVDLEPGEEKRLEVQLEKTAVDQPKPIKESEKMISNSIGMKFVYIPPGTFIMGSPKNEPGRSDDETQHEVTLTRGFYIQTTEVTQEQWERVMDNNPAIFKDCGENCPVEYVSWNDVQRFIEKLNTKESTKRYRLPPKPSGSMHAALEPRLHSHLATIKRPCPITAGIVSIRENLPIRWEGRSPTSGDCTICTAMLRSGARTRMMTILPKT
jgi:hypothetical protein